jgi:glutamyl-tRNA synthetase
MTQVRTRFAPSPTGYLHVGGARTALFSWLFARHHGGQFILRIEDTDLARSTQDSVHKVLEDMKWLGFDWDEGPDMDGKSSHGPHGSYFQSQRLAVYQTHLEKLKVAGRAYPTFDSKAEVEAEREAAIAAGHTPVTVAHEATPEEVAEKARQGIQPAWRFRMPESGQTEFKDLVHGQMRFENRLMSDFVLVRSSGIPTFQFAGVVDDALMQVTHVIRGDDHLSNTPTQVCLYQALGFEIPLFAHIPMILGADRQKLSKRHGETAVGQYRATGFLPEALVNYLALLGWAFDGEQTIFSLDELKEKFGLEKVGKNAAVFDTAKLEWMNGHYIRSASLERAAAMAWPFFLSAGLVNESQRLELWPWFCRLVASLKEKVRTLADLPAEAGYFFRDFEGPEPEALAKFFAGGVQPAWLGGYVRELEGMQDFSAQGLEGLTRAQADRAMVKFGAVVAPLRSALTGRTVSPGLFETMELLGRKRCLERIRKSLDWKVPEKV